MEKTDNNLRIRPRFRKEVSDAPEIVKNKIKTALVKNSTICTGKIVQET